MTAKTVNAQVKEGPAVTFEYDFGDTIEQAYEIFGADVVWAFAERGLIIAAQGHARGLLKSGKSVDEIHAAFKEWKPGAPRETKSSEDRVREQFAKMSPEDRAALLRELSGAHEEPAAEHPAPAKQRRSA
jgi:hypothetical protein